MAAFEYLVLDQRGKEKKGVLEGDNDRQVRQQLREKGWTPLKVKVVAKQKKSTKAFQFSGGKSLNSTELAITTRQIATLVGSGLPIETALNAVAQQSEKEKIKHIIMAVRSSVLEGQSLAAGFSAFPQAFPEMFCTTVAAGEQSGHLDVVLNRLADYTENRHAMAQKVQMALLYPVMLTVMAVLIVIGLLAYVVPEVVTVFEDMGQELPFLTRALIASSEFLVANGLLLFIAAVISVIGISHTLAKPKPKFLFHKLLLRLPLVRRLVRGADTARFSRTFSILSASGVPILSAMEISAQVMVNLPMRHSVEEAAVRVREGADIKSSLEAGGYISAMTLQLIASGEVSGNLSEMLERAAENQERELETLITALLGLLEPLMIFVMGGIVLVIVLAILMPIFELNTMIS